jgi:cephalosporin-C deacetylase-like acetyl esterase
MTAAEFEAYWAAICDALAAVPAAPEITPVPLRSNETATLYEVRLTSTGPYRIFGHLSIPTGKGPFPALYFAPKYQSVVQPVPQGTSNALRGHFVTFSLAARGQRNADKPYAAGFPGWLTDGIAGAETYIFRGVAADTLRGLEFLAKRPEIDTARLAVIGNDLAWIAAALGTAASHVACGPELFWGGLPGPNAGYPRAEIGDYLRQNPGDKDAVTRTLALFDPAAFAPKVTAKRLILAGPKGSGTDAAALAAMTDGADAVHESEQSHYKDGMALMTWIAAQYGLGDPAAFIPPAWR